MQRIVRLCPHIFFYTANILFVSGFSKCSRYPYSWHSRALQVLKTMIVTLFYYTSSFTFYYTYSYYQKTRETRTNLLAWDCCDIPIVTRVRNRKVDHSWISMGTLILCTSEQKKRMSRLKQRFIVSLS